VIEKTEGTDLRRGLGGKKEKLATLPGKKREQGFPDGKRGDMGNTDSQNEPKKKSPVSL